MRKYLLYGTDVMISNPKRLLLAGVLVSALAMAVGAVWSGRDELAGDHSGVGRDDASASGAPDKNPAGSMGSGAVSAEGGSDAGVARTLQVIRDSLERNDLASARLLLNAVLALHQDNEQALALRKDLQAREQKADVAVPAEHAEKPSKAGEPARPAPRPPARPDRQRTISTPHRPHGGNASHNLVATAPGVMNIGAKGTGSASAETASPSPPATPAVTSPPALPSSIPLQRPSAPIVEAKPEPMAAESDQAPKTRAQVRAELARARMDGSLPRFGNPDPAGPGGSHGFVVQSTASPERE
jgi:hypothetical protein